ncbi:MAG: glycine zipper 2TM domain-containing protein [Sulfuritalea sp.]|nr:glycine zipper 2TM domain-containing protein [Sulfuritalea sp.]
METTSVIPATIVKPQTHPLLLVAAASVTVLSLAGAGVLAGWLPGPGARSVEAVKMASTTAPLPAAAPISIQQTVTIPQEKAKPATTSGQRAPVSVRRTPSTAYGPAVAVSPAPTYGTASTEPVYRVSTPMPTICNDCGVVQAVNEVAVEPKGSGGGAVAGGIVGGILGNQVGKGATRDFATVLGAVGGAFAGNHIEKSVKESKRYDVVVRFEDGSTRTFSSDSPPTWHSGDRVKLQNGTLIMGGGNSSGIPGTI